jgi:hypothetical protein
MIGVAHPRRNVQPSAGGQRSSPQPTARRRVHAATAADAALARARLPSQNSASLPLSPASQNSERALRFALSARFDVEVGCDGTQSRNARRSQSHPACALGASRPRAKLSSAAAAAQPCKKTHSRPLRHGRGAGEGRVKTAHAPDVVTLRGAPLLSCCRRAAPGAAAVVARAPRRAERGVCRHAP